MSYSTLQMKNKQLCMICHEELQFDLDWKVSFCRNGCLKLEDFIKDNLGNQQEENIKKSLITNNRETKESLLNTQQVVQKTPLIHQNNVDSLEHKLQNLTSICNGQNLRDFRNQEMKGTNLSSEEINALRVKLVNDIYNKYN